MINLSRFKLKEIEKDKYQYGLIRYRS